eukprot:TRINITY_DN2326_c0_g1_i2.p1 TRINITY_DN2326_c0_g1~~TRINITY_DN2326_c0_g1_i2.p1  ORF type:complete len:685 (-),score=123.39 TRINITY_DN2326_c0_g1_i2:352-2382(-)
MAGMADFFRHLAALGAEHERVQAENAELRRVLASGHGVDALGEFQHSALEQADSEWALQGRWPTPPVSVRLRLASQEQQGADILAMKRHKRALSFERQHGAPPSDSVEEGLPSTPPVSPKLTPKTRQGVFDIGDMKEKMKKEMLKNTGDMDVTRFYKTSGCIQFVARHRLFENTTMSIIVMYAIWMSIDTDHNTGSTLSDTPPVFIVADQFFCMYFTVELIVRFLAFERKVNCMRDAWFVFDFILVSMMVAETWVMNFVLLSMSSSGSGSGLGDFPVLRLARLARLTRLLRMARLLRYFPELIILVKAIAAAARSVSFTMALLMILIYIFGIAFTSILKDSDVGNASFPTVLYSMHSLLVHGAFCDDLTGIMTELIKESYIALTLMYILILLAAVTVMNMLIGILCEVITAVADAEREAIQLGFVKETLQRCLAAGVDKNDDGCIDQAEFLSMLETQDCIEALTEIDVDVVSIYDYIQVLFEEGEESKMPFVEFIDMLLKLRGGNAATVKDLVDLRKWLAGKMNDMEELVKVNGSTLGSPPVLLSAPAWERKRIVHDDSPSQRSDASLLLSGKPDKRTVGGDSASRQTDASPLMSGNRHKQIVNADSASRQTDALPSLPGKQDERPVNGESGSQQMDALPLLVERPDQRAVNGELGSEQADALPSLPGSLDVECVQ